MTQRLDYVDYDGTGQPKGTIGKLVSVKFKHDGHVTVPIPADEVDWCSPGDPVEMYAIAADVETR